jgi:hypothetical protein
MKYVKFLVFICLFLTIQGCDVWTTTVLSNDLPESVEVDLFYAMDQADLDTAAIRDNTQVIRWVEVRQTVFGLLPTCNAELKVAPQRAIRNKYDADVVADWHKRKVCVEPTAQKDAYVVHQTVIAGNKVLLGRVLGHHAAHPLDSLYVYFEDRIQKVVTQEAFSDCIQRSGFAEYSLSFRKLKRQSKKMYRL